MMLVCAATPWEAGPLARHLGLAPLPGRPRTYAGDVGGREVRLLETGMGRESVAAALSSVEPAPKLVVSAGFAGALQEGLKPADLVADLRGTPVEWVQSARAAAAELRTPLHLGAFHSAERILAPEEKRAAGRAHRAVAVDLESAAIRDWAEEHGAVFAGVRAVFDKVAERVPQGGPKDASARAVVRFLASNWRQAPRFARLWPRQVRGMRALGRFLAYWISTIEGR